MQLYIVTKFTMSAVDIYIYVSKSDLRFFIFPMLLIEVYMRFEDLFVIFTKKNNNYRRRIYVFKS